MIYISIDIEDNKKRTILLKKMKIPVSSEDKVEWQ